MIFHRLVHSVPPGVADLIDCGGRVVAAVEQLSSWDRLA
jgi:hypothetical protein